MTHESRGVQYPAHITHSKAGHPERLCPTGEPGVYHHPRIPFAVTQGIRSGCVPRVSLRVYHHPRIPHDTGQGIQSGCVPWVSLGVYHHLYVPCAGTQGIRSGCAPRMGPMMFYHLYVQCTVSQGIRSGCVPRIGPKMRYNSTPLPLLSRIRDQVCSMAGLLHKCKSFLTIRAAERQPGGVIHPIHGTELTSWQG